jgi:hypothetical protein
VVLATSDAGRRRSRLSLRSFIVAVLLGALAVVALGLRLGFIDDAWLQARADSRTEVEADRTVILQELAEQSDLIVAERSLAPVTVDAENIVSVRVPLLGEQDVPTALAGESETAAVGPGRVELRVDLADLHTGDITVKNGVVSVRAPLPRIATVDEGPVQTIDEQTGLVTRTGEVVLGDGQTIQQEELAASGHDRMLDAARQDAELFELGRKSLERTLRRLLVTVPGVDRVDVRYPTVAEACRTHDAPGFCASNRGAEVTDGGVQ